MTVKKAGKKKTGVEKEPKCTASSSSSNFCISAAVVTSFASAAIVADFGGFAKCILHFCPSFCPFRGVLARS
jgi:hypothetical protein